MKKLKTAVCISLIAVIALGAAVGISAMNHKLWFQKETTSDAYDFPITPTKTPEEWKKLITHPQMVAACQVPEKTLKNMSTQGLIETCLNYPLFGEVFAYNSYMEGLEFVTSQFNGMRELETRSDAAKELLDYYKNIDYDEVVNSSDPYYTLRIRFFDFYMSQDQVLLKLSSDERAELLKACSNAVSIKNQKYSDTFSIGSNLYLAACILRIDDKEFGALITGSNYNDYFKYGQVSEELAAVILEKLDIKKD